jgi:hypothetical protein
MTFPQLQLINSETDGFRSAQTTSKKQAQERRISLPSQSASIGGIKQLLGLVACQPIADSTSKLFDSLNPSNVSCLLGAQPSTLSRLIGQSPDRRKMKIYRGCRKGKTLKERAISNHDTTVKPKTRLGAIPIDESFDGISVRSAGMRRRQGG